MNTDSNRAALGLVLFTLAILCLQGCSYQAWYEGFKMRERQECYKHPDNDDIETCLERVNNMNYNEYKNSRRN